MPGDMLLVNVILKNGDSVKTIVSKYDIEGSDEQPISHENQEFYENLSKNKIKKTRKKRKK